MRAGPVELPGNVLLSPLCGVTDSPFRRIARRNGAAMVFCEMTSSDGLVRKNPKTFELLEYRPEERPIGAQLCGSDPAVMAEAARICEGLGFDTLDLNYGCPVRKVIAREAGAAMLTDLERLERVTAAVVNAVQLPVTAKIRMGWDKTNTNAPEVAKVLERSGVRWVTVHARARSEKFTGQAHWEVIAEVKANTTLPVIGNGDVKTPEDALRMIQETGCDGVMVGRGSFGNPWLFARAHRLLNGDDPGPEPTPRERIATAIGHLHDLAEKKGDYAATLMRKHVAWYVRGLYDNSSLCREVNHAATPAEVESLLLNYLERIESAPEPQIPEPDSPDAGWNGGGVDAHGSCAAS
ncbi:MAG TPA: tRNA dihydrouridine synthase DusB [Candidatus Dormibacteraeota bacterium]|nr:tRNA dihydrouridine synthase DusB [Candidatus Dormibacteraeota bacterium]